jgi:hypothetical protein
MNKNLGVLDAGNLEGRVMRPIEKKNRFSARRVTVSLITASLVLAVSAAFDSALALSLGQDKDAKPNFTGIWKAESLTKVAGEPPIPPGAEKEKIEVDHKDPELKMRKTIEGLNWVAEPSFTSDGKERPTSFANEMVKSKAVWSGKQLIISYWIENAEIATWLTETWNLDDDRKTLTITKELQKNKWKIIFKRQ